MKKITSVMLLAAVLLTCTACSKSETEDTGSDSSVSSQFSIAEQSTAESSNNSNNESANTPSSSTNESTGSSSSSGKTSAPTVPTDLKPSEGFEFESNGDGTCTLVKIGTCTDKDIVVPEKSPDGDIVTHIGEYALMSLKADSVTLINYNYEIDEWAFQYGKFETLNIIGGNPVFGESAFSSCEDIETITFQNCKIETGEYSFISCGKDAVLTFTDCTGYIDERAFQYGDFESISFTGCDLELDKSSFSSCENVKTLTITDSKISADEYSFMSLGKSADIEITNSDIKLEDRAFQYSSLNTLNVIGGTLEMGDSVFSSCEDLTDITIDCDSVSIGKYAFMSCEDLVNASICDNENMDNQIEIDDRAFQYCKRLASVKIGSGDIKIGSYAFNDCADEITITVAGKHYTADSLKNGI